MGRRTITTLLAAGLTVVGLAALDTASGAASGTIDQPGRVDRIVRRTDIAPVAKDGYTYTFYENRAYPCSISGYQTFAIGAATGSSDTAPRPLWVKMHGGGKGWFDDAGAPKPTAGQKKQEPLSKLVGYADGGLTRLVRHTTAGFRVLLVSMCSHDIYAGVNTTDPHNPNLDGAGNPRTTNGLISVKAAIQYFEAHYPTTDFFLHGTSAGGAGVLNVGWGLQRQGLVPDGIVSDSGLINQEAELARVQQGTCGAGGETLDTLTRASARWAPEVIDPANQPDLTVSRGDFTVPIVHVWNKGDHNTCGNTPMTCPLRDGSTPTLWSATCGHTPMQQAIASLPASRHSQSMGVCVNSSTTDGNPCDRHVVTVSPEVPANYLPTIVTWVVDRLNDD